MIAFRSCLVYTKIKVESLFRDTFRLYALHTCERSCGISKVKGKGGQIVNHCFKRFILEK
jgi:hypothetical protein